MFGFIRRTDSWLQKRFDRVAHAVMRQTGATKRSLRRNGWGFAIACIVGTHVFWQGPMRSWVGGGVLLCVYSAQLYLDDRCDAQAEESGYRVASVADRSAFTRKLLGIILTLSPLLFLTLFGSLTLGRTFEALFALTFFFQGYLCGTSPQAPKKKQAEARAPLLARLRFE